MIRSALHDYFIKYKDEDVFRNIESTKDCFKNFDKNKLVKFRVRKLDLTRNRLITEMNFSVIRLLKSSFYGTLSF